MIRSGVLAVVCRSTKFRPYSVHGPLILVTHVKLSNGVKSISYLKAHAAELISHVAKSGNSLVITQNGEARAVLQDVESYEQTRESLVLLKMLAMSSAHEEAGLTKPVGKAFRDVRTRLEQTE